jgi:DnaJ-class molecular chaperone
MRTFYEIIGVSKDASDSEIKSAWRKKMQILAPDKTIGDKKAELEFLAVEKAYKVLGNKHKRKEYDEFLKGGQPIKKPQIIRQGVPSGIKSPLPNDIIDASRIIDISNLPKGKPFRIF